MNLTELVDALVTETRLTVYKNQLTRRVRDAITGVHSAAFFAEDVKEDMVLLGTANKHTTFQVPLPPRFRKFKAIKPANINKQMLCITTEDDSYRETEAGFDRNFYNEKLQDTYYKAGKVININSSVAPAYLYLQWYSAPEVADPLLETWIMQQYPQLIMDWALARFWKVNGKESIARDIERTLYSVDVQNLINNHATSDGL